MIVDSGADESCLPMHMAYTGESMGSKGPSFCDAQGHPLHVHDRRTCVMQFLNLDQDVKTFKETCLVSSVNSPLFAVGKLYRLGWGTFWHGDQFVLGLQSDPSTYIPCSFRHNSIVAKGWIRRVHTLPPSVPSSPKNAKLNVAGMQVRAVVAKLGKVLERLIQSATYFQPLIDGVWGIQLESDKFVDVHEALPNEGLEYRTTLAYLDGQWRLLELSEHIDRLPEVSAQLPGVTSPCKCICFAHRAICSPSDLGFEVQGSSMPSGVVPTVDDGLGVVDDSAEQVGAASGSPDEVQQHGMAVDPEGQASLEAKRLDEPELLPDEIEVLGVTLRPTDSLKTLREACVHAGIGKSGGKATVYQRLYNFVKRYDIQQRIGEQPAAPVPNAVKPVAEPTDEERRLHELTHLPFKNWCLFCQEHKSRSDAHKASDVSQHGVPTISFDFSFTGREEGGKDKLVALVVRDSFSGWREAIPVARKGGATSRSYLASEVTRLLNMLGHGTVKLRCDPESVCLALRDEIIKRRSKFGHRTLFDQVAEGEHQSNGGAEAAVHQTRLQAGVLLSQYEARSGKSVQTTHPLHSWSMRHASWLLNRFGQARSGTTPFEDVMNTTYRGKVCSFGMSVLSLARGTAKGRPSWVKSIWLGKSASSDQHITCTAGGKLLLTRSVRLLNPQYDATLHDAVRDQSWQHPGLLAGTVGKSATQRTKEVTDTGELSAEAAADGVGAITPLVVPPPGTPDEAGTDLFV